MGVINCSPESFFSGSYVSPKNVFDRAVALREMGADIIDVGARSTAPGISPIPVSEERERMVTALESLSGSGILVSVDTTRPEVLDAVLHFNIAAINDIGGLTDSSYVNLAADSGLPVIAMAAIHQPGDPVGIYETMLALRLVLDRANTAGITDLVLDPAIGKWTPKRTSEQDWALCRNFSKFLEFGQPLLAAISRKSFIGELLNVEPAGRLAGSLAVTSFLLDQGASIVRAHDIAETRDIIRVYEILRGNQ